MAKYFPGKSISKIHGTAQKRDGIIYYAMYHPAAALHQGSLRPVIEADFAKLPELIAQANQHESPPEAEDENSKPQQLSLF